MNFSPSTCRPTTDRAAFACLISVTAIRHIFVSPGHNFFGRHQAPAGTYETHEVAAVKCRAGWGLEGDRFYGYRPGYKGQVTFFAWETLIAARKKFGVAVLGADVFRRNVLIEGLDLGALIGMRFALGGVEFEGCEESRPCHWMNQVVAPGAEDWLRGRGGLRAKILTDGELRIGPVELRLLQEAAQPRDATGFVGKRAV
jgi:MOSC domain-containing protein YiiM